MRKIFLLAFALIGIACSDNGSDAKEFNPEEVCPAGGNNAYGMPNRGTFIDERDGQEYKYTTIGSQVWMAENLKYEAEYSACDTGKENFCELYGRYYSLQLNGSIAESLDERFVDTVCPNGWHIPTIGEWTEMINVVGGFGRASAEVLNGKENWGFTNYPGQDACGFTVLPAGFFMAPNMDLGSEGVNAIFWTSTEVEKGLISTIKFGYETAVFNSMPKMSVRCLKD